MDGGFAFFHTSWRLSNCAPPSRVRVGGGGARKRGESADPAGAGPTRAPLPPLLLLTSEFPKRNVSCAQPITSDRSLSVRLLLALCSSPPSAPARLFVRSLHLPSCLTFLITNLCSPPFSATPPLCISLCYQRTINIVSLIRPRPAPWRTR